MTRLGIAESDGRCWITVEGELDRHTTGWFRQHLVALGKRGCREVLIDLGRTTFIDSSGLNLLLGAMEGMDDLGGRLVLRAPPAEVYELGRVRRLAELMAIVDKAVEEAEAIERLSTLFASADLQGSSPSSQAWVVYEAGATDPSDSSSNDGRSVRKDERDDVPAARNDSPASCSEGGRSGQGRTVAKTLDRDDPATRPGR